MLPRLNLLSGEIACLPTGWWLTQDDRERIVAAVKEFSATVAAEAGSTSPARLLGKPAPLKSRL